MARYQKGDVDAFAELVSPVRASLDKVDARMQALETARASAYAGLQDREFESSREHGYSAVRHQRFVGTGYFDEVAQAISGGLASTLALAGSTEAQQFH